MPTPILEVRDLTVSVQVPGGRRATVVDHVNFSIDERGTLGLVGESGSGKTLTSLAIVGLLPPAARIETGQILLEGEDLTQLSRRQMQRIRGRRIAMVMQDPLTALDPSFTIGSQLADPLRRHRGLRGHNLESAMVSALEQVQLSAAKERLSQHPHLLSGGMRQRVTSAIALAGGPRLLIADEPTTALDMTTQARYLNLLRRLQEEEGFALLLIAHDLMVVRHVCERVNVMYAGEVVEEGATAQVFTDPRQPYTKALLGAIPTVGDVIRLEAIGGHAPDVTDEIAGCRFAARCRHARDVCRSDHPMLTTRDSGGHARCWATEPNGWST
jgi:oligopeptide/dipeptide ABC transporter ATP-binding protein